MLGLNKLCNINNSFKGTLGWVRKKKTLESLYYCPSHPHTVSHSSLSWLKFSIPPVFLSPSWDCRQAPQLVCCPLHRPHRHGRGTVESFSNNCMLEIISNISYIIDRRFCFLKVSIHTDSRNAFYRNLPNSVFETWQSRVDFSNLGLFSFYQLFNDLKSMRESVFRKRGHTWTRASQINWGDNALEAIRMIMRQKEERLKTN